MVTKSVGSSTLVFFLLINAVLVSTLRKDVVSYINWLISAEFTKSGCFSIVQSIDKMC